MKIISETLTALVAVGLVAVGLFYYSSQSPSYLKEYGASAMVYAPGLGSGSGTFITPTKVLTARHVARVMTGLQPVELIIEDVNGGQHKVIGVEYPNTMVDAAILIVEEPLVGHEPAPYSCRLPAIGEELHNIGTPWGMIKWFWSKAWVSSYETNYKGAKVSPSAVFNGMVLFQGVSIGGMSGSGMFDKDGNVVGILVVGLGDPARSKNNVDTIGGFIATSFICDWLNSEVAT